MSKYTMTLEDYVLSRQFAKMLEDDIDTEWTDVLFAVDADPSIAYDIIAGEVLPNLPAFLYSDDQDIIEEFIAGFVDKFYFCEIGQETMGRFKWALRAYFRNSRDKWSQLYSAQIRSFSELLNMNDYRRITHDALKKTGKDTTDFTHGHTLTITPTRTQKNKIIPLGGSAETELNESAEGGNETHADTGKDTTELTHDTTDDRWNVEEMTGYASLDKAALMEKFRALILDINSMIYEDIKKNHLFLEVW